MTQNPLIVLLNDVDASAQVSGNSSSQCLNHMWTIEVCKTGTDGNPLLLIEESSDETEWFPYIDKEICSDCIIDSEILLNDDKTLIKDEFFPSKYIRATLKPNGTTTGTVKAVLSTKIRQ